MYDNPTAEQPPAMPVAREKAVYPVAVGPRGSTRDTARWSYINCESSSLSIASDVKANSSPRHDRRHNGAIATRHMGCEFGLRPVEFKNGETVATVE
jgi:hypothetical protein